MDNLLTCNCGEILVKSMDGTTKLRGKIFLFRGDQGYVVCKGCGAEREVPATLSQDQMQMLSRSPKLFVSGSRK